MEPGEELEAITDVVATLGELVAIITPPCRSTWPLLYPRSLCADLRRFTCRLHEALKRHSVTFLRQRSVTPLGQAVAALRATPGATWADVRAAVKGWRKSVYELEDSWYWLVEDAANLLDYWKNKVTTEATTKATATAQAGDLQDESTSWETAGDNPVAAAQQPPVPPDKDKLDLMLDAHFARVDAAKKAMEEAMVATSQAGTATRRGQQVEVAVGLLGRLVVECDRADQLSWELHDQLDDMEAALEGKKEVPTDVPEALVVAVDKFQQLWEASSRQNKRHLLRRLEVIYHLLLSPYGSSGGPGGHSVAKRCQEAIEDTWTPSKKQRPVPSCSRTNNGSSITGTPQQPEGTWGKPKPGAAGETAGDLPSDPNLLPPGARCELATSKSITFLKKYCYECIPTGVTGTSQQRQDFLIIGKESNESLGLSVLPAVISANCNEELRVLAFTHKAPMVIQPKMPIAIAIVLPMNTNKRAGYQEMPFESFNSHGRWVKHIGNAQPMLTCRLTCSNESQKCPGVTPATLITGTLDTGADVTVISYESWPKDWNLVPPMHSLTGIGGGVISMQSEFMITVTGLEGKTAKTRPYVVKRPITLWGRDVLSQWGTNMKVDS
ncbi:uncharacterized protein LOC120747928 [Hirundo rustica]|uniref:uncharacterized protein LOC120747928 n=1 Tax=Hirundo rustica TaxID=43150 RepID=UPI001A944192|nr:uncharacterized protein LOC120747928 [Hirundo rustica]